GERPAALRVAAGPGPREGRSDRRGRRRALPRLQPLSGDGMESAARSRLGSGGAGRHPPDERPDRAGVAVAAPALYRRDVSRAAGDSPRPLLRRLRRVPRGDAAEPADRCLVVSPRPACRGAPPLWGRSGRAARADEPRRPADLPGRAPDEAGPDAHVGVDREPGALSRSGAGRVRGGAAGALPAPRLAV